VRQEKSYEQAASDSQSIYKTLQRLTDSLLHLSPKSVLIFLSDRNCPVSYCKDYQENLMKSARSLSIAAAFFIGTAALFAQGMHGHGPDGEFSHMLNFYADKLDLSSAQQDQMKAIWEKEKPALKPLMQQERQNHEAMKALEESGPFDEAKTRALATQNSQTMVELQVQHARIKSEMMQVLTADQKTKLQQLEADHQANMRSHTQMKDQEPPTSD
jgi:protein CpxP